MRNKSALAVTLLASLLATAGTAQTETPGVDIKDQNGNLIAGFSDSIHELISYQKSIEGEVTCVKMAMAAHYFTLRSTVGYEAYEYTLGQSTFETANDVRLAAAAIAKLEKYTANQALTGPEYIEFGCDAVR